MRTPQERPTQIGLILLIATIVVLLDCIAFHGILQSIYPYGDEIPLKANSAHLNLDWLTQGFATYFDAYPEYSKPFANFIRPFVNIIYWLFRFDKTGLAQLIIVNYGTHGLIVGILVGLALKRKRSTAECILIGLTALALPGFWVSPMTMAPAFAYDGLTALISLLSILNLSAGRTATGLILLTAALFTKETALPVVAATCLYGHVTRQKKIWSWCYGLLITWALVRLYAFGSIFDGVYAAPPPGQSFLIVKKLFLPHVLPYGRNNHIFQDPILTGKAGSHTLRNIYEILTLALFYFGTKILKSTPIRLEETKPNLKYSTEGTHFLTLTATLCSMLYFILIGQETRFSYLPSTLLLAWIVYTNTQKDLPTLFLIMLCASSIILSGIAFYRSHQNQCLPIEAAHSSRMLMQAISQRPIGPPVYTLLDFSSRMASGASIQLLTRAQRQIKRGLSVNMDECHEAAPRYFNYSIIDKTKNSVTAKFSIPKCARFIFEGTKQEILIKNLKGTFLKRSKNINYEFPFATVNTSHLATAAIDWGSEANVTITDATAVIWNGVDWQWLN